MKTFVHVDLPMSASSVYASASSENVYSYHDPKPSEVVLSACLSVFLSITIVINVVDKFRRREIIYLSTVRSKEKREETLVSDSFSLFSDRGSEVRS